MTFKQRMWRRSRCWINTTHAVDRTGYGAVKVDGRKISTHRAAYTVLVGPIPPKHDLDHLCGERNCYNPDHLEPVTRKQHGARNHNAKKTECPRGHAYSSENTYVDPRGYRNCRACARLHKHNINNEKGHMI